MMVIPCLCLSRFSSCTATTKKYPDQRSGGIFLGRHSYALGTLTESDGWCLYGLRLLIFPQPLGRALKNQNAAPTTPPCFSRRLRSSLLHWADCLRRYAPPPCSSPFHRANKKEKPVHNVYWFFLVQECNPNPNHFPRMQLPSLLQKSRSVSLLYS